MNFQDVLNAVKSDGSDNAASKKLGITRQMFSGYRNGHYVPSDDVLDKMIELSGLSVESVYLAAYAEKLNNPKAAEAFRHLAA